ncbi:hypothetical protein JG688_00015395 [Phytophthora aleatoria]|uniref:Telomerase reverse transcriptase n=1 Tax=Phytophthora aleatoria TaxID=2496075 RepID=A0A8J5IEA1_9STRA|nr:hypothetical protein JG688_00015395 [Phytophthora aleatoria]
MEALLAKASTLRSFLRSASEERLASGDATLEQNLSSVTNQDVLFALDHTFIIQSHTTGTELVHHVIERLLARKRAMNWEDANVLTLGYREVTPGAVGHRVTQSNGIICYYPNTLVAALKKPLWGSLHELMGDDLMTHLLLNYTILVQLKENPDSYMQKMVSRFKACQVEELATKLVPVNADFRKFMADNASIKRKMAERTADAKTSSQPVIQPILRKALEDGYLSQSEDIAPSSDRKRKRREEAIELLSHASTRSSKNSPEEAVRMDKKHKKSDTSSGKERNVHEVSDLTKLQHHKEDIKKMLAFATPKKKIFRLIRRFIAEVVPKELWGSSDTKKNWKCVKMLLRKLIFSRKFVVFSLEKCAEEFQVTKVEWMNVQSKGKYCPPNERVKRLELLEDLLWWVMSFLVFPLLRNLFYITEAEGMANEIAYYQHVERCFDTIRPRKLYQMLKKALTEDEYLIRKHWVGHQVAPISSSTDSGESLPASSFFFKLERPACPSGDLLGFDELAAQSTKKNSMFVDCELFRYTDDFMYISTDLKRARKFFEVMHEGNEEYGCFVNVAKTQANFEVKSGGEQAADASKDCISWCGMLIDPNHLQVYVNYEKLGSSLLQGSIPFNETKPAQDFFVNKVISPIRQRWHALYFDPELLSEDSIHVNLFQMLVVAAHRFTILIEMLPFVNRDMHFFHCCILRILKKMTKGIHHSLELGLESGKSRAELGNRSSKLTYEAQKDQLAIEAKRDQDKGSDAGHFKPKCQWADWQKLLDAVQAEQEEFNKRAKRTQGTTALKLEWFLQDRRNMCVLKQFLQRRSA